MSLTATTSMAGITVATMSPAFGTPWVLSFWKVSGNSLSRAMRKEIAIKSTIYRRFDSTVHATVHVWFQEPGLVQCKTAVSAIVAALHVDAQIEGVLVLDNFIVHDMHATQTRFMREPKYPVALHKLFDQTVFQSFQFVLRAA